MIEVTDKAQNKIIEFMEEQGYDKDHFLRVGVTSGGCSGLSYKLDFDKEVKDDDQEVSNDKVKIVVDMKSYLYLYGTRLDFSDGLNGKGFQFVNPNATRTCGCGESFGV